MTRILLRAPKSPFDAVSPERVLGDNLIGGNSGNLIFLETAYKLLSVPGREITPTGSRPTRSAPTPINERFDAYVIPLANAFRRDLRGEPDPLHAR